LRAVARKSPLLRRALPWALALVCAAALAALGAFLLWRSLPDPAPLARENPRTTALVEQRREEAKEKRRTFRPRQTWVRLEAISPRLIEAVIASEDANFFGHEGIDWAAVRAAADHDLKVRRFARGASTITQQLAKNLWLGTRKSLWRKTQEAVLAAKLERVLSKRRILALYLNVVELDDGVFGVEAGARHRFGVGAADLSTAQAVVLASMLPAPRRADLSHPSAWLRGRSRRLLDRLRDARRLSVEEHLAASAALDRILAGPAPADDGEEPPEEDASGEPIAAVESPPAHPERGGALSLSKDDARSKETPTEAQTPAADGNPAEPPAPVPAVSRGEP
jgi:monofunctional biosynthetic peptidoglycan transglycosylase